MQSRIIKYLETETSPLTSQQTQMADKALADLFLPSDFDRDEFNKLLVFTIEGCKQEVPSLNESQILQTAISYAIKLTLMFGNKENAIAYLKRFEERHPQLSNPLELAFVDAAGKPLQLPSKINWKKWQQIINEYKPTDARHVVLSSLVLAEEIEKYIEVKRVTLEKEILAEVNNEFELYYSMQYDQLIAANATTEDEWVNEKMQKLHDEYARLATVAVMNSIKKQLNIPLRGKLSEEQQLSLKNYDKAKKEREYQQILDEIKQEKRTELIRAYKQTANFNATKQDYIEKQMKNTEYARGKIANERSEDLFPTTIPLQKLITLASKVYYSNADLNPKLAALYFKNNITPENFDKYLKFHPVNEKDNHIPAVKIDGAMLSDLYSGYYIEKLAHDDPLASITGVFTSCCMTMGKEGTRLVEYAIKNPNGGLYVLKRKNNEGEDIIVSQCFAWRGKNGELVFDSIESQTNFFAKNRQLIADFFFYLAQDLVKNHHIPSVLIGRGSHHPATELFLLNPTNVAVPQGFDTHDASTQHIIAMQGMPILLQQYLHSNAQSKLRVSSSDKMTVRALSKWLSLMYFNRENFSTLLSPTFIDDLNLLTNQSITRDQINAGINNITDLVNFIRELMATKTLPPVWQARLNQYINNGGDIDLQANSQNIPSLIHLAVNLNLNELAEYLIDHGANINLQDNNGNTPLLLAQQLNNESLINLLIAKGADINVIGNDHTLLTQEAIHGSFERFKCYLDLGADPSVKRSDLSSILHLLVQNKKIEILEYLLPRLKDFNIDINSRDINGSTALHLAATPEVVKLLLLNGADPDQENNYGVTFRFMCTYEREEDETISSLLDSQSINIEEQRTRMASKLRQFLIENNFSNLRIEDYRSILITAYEKNYFDLVEYFLKEYKVELEPVIIHKAMRDQKWGAINKYLVQVDRFSN